MSRTKVLVVEDDHAVRRGLCDALKHNGFDVVECERGDKAVDAAVEAQVDLVLLDLMLPGADGFEVLPLLRQAAPALPVIMVTARGAEEDRVRGLVEGADDYVIKPFSAKELLARVEAVLRRSPERARGVKVVRTPHATIDLERHEVRTADGQRLELTDREASLLRYLASSPGRAVTRDELLQRVWGISPRNLQTRTVDMQLARLREKVEADPSKPTLILTVRGRGYMLGEGSDVETL